MKSATRATLLILAVLLTGAVSASAQDPDSQDDAIGFIRQPDDGRFTDARAWIGAFSPHARSSFWDSNFQNFTATRSRLDSVIFGAEYVKSFDRHNALSLGGSLYLGAISEPARYVRDEEGNPLEHHLEVTLASVTAGYLLYPAGTDHRLIPYLGAGIGLYFGTLDTYRHATDNTPDDCDDPSECGDTIFTDKRSSNFYTMGYYLEGGLEVPVTEHMALLLDGRYTVAHTDLGRDFEPDQGLDLSGEQVAAGVSFRF